MTKRRLILVIILILSTSLTTVGVIIAREPATPGKSTLAAEPVGSGFTYQGRVDFQGTPANGGYDFQFDIYDVAEGGAPLATTIEEHNITVANGLFTVHLDFGDIFTGEARWLEIRVKPTEQDGPFTPLSPRQPLTATPYATFAGNGPFWSLTGNADTSPESSFLGTTDDQPLVIKTNGRETMRVAASGNVSIGTADSTADLTVLGNLSQELTGNVTVPTDSTTVIGNGTLFTQELNVGDALLIGNERFVVDTIVSDTELTLDSPHTAGALSVPGFTDSDLLRIQNGAGVEHFVVDKSGGITLQVFGEKETLSLNTVYQAATDGFVMAKYTAASPNGNGRVYGVVGDSAPPTTTITEAWAFDASDSFIIPIAHFIMPVRQGEFWQVLKQDRLGPPGSAEVKWMPLGN